MEAVSACCPALHALTIPMPCRLQWDRLRELKKKEGEGREGRKREGRGGIGRKGEGRRRKGRSV